MGVVGVDTGVDTGMATETGDAGTETDADAETETEMGDTRSPSVCLTPSLASMSCSIDAHSRVALSGSGTSSTSGHDEDTGAGRELDMEAGLVSQCSVAIALRLDGGGVTARRLLACASA